LERDPVAARSEFLGEFRSQVSGFISRDLLLQAVDQGTTERPPSPQFQYVAFCDAASGIASSGDGDRFALAIGHLEGDVVVIDYCKRWMPFFNASEVTGEVAVIAKAYRCDEVISDGFSSGYLRAELLRHGVGHRVTEFDKSKLYLATLPALTSRRVRFPDLKFIVDEFAALERKPGSAGHDKIDARGHEDAANVCAGVIAQFAAGKPSSADNWLEFYRRLNEQAFDTDSIRPAGPAFGFSFNEPFVKIELPPGPISEDGFVLTRGGRVGANRIGDRLIVDVRRDEAIALLKGGKAWRDANADLARDLLGEAST